ncbi:peroxiredoxin family protein [Aliifodinibius halophilus]|uniref:Peroxiredoxin family protein n=1 Tax=Fodinibius halophilus TaxID=1736908 RepID=A0A6M1TCM9_9BACT|nr:peroxiredoxin family protein [Fodinibius halophilus]
MIEKSSKYNLFVFFSDDDCMACTTEFVYYNRLNSDIHKSNLFIKGITNVSDSSLINAFVKQNDIKFEVYKSEELFKKYTIGDTPQSVLINVERDNIIIFRSFRKKTLSSQQATYDIINLIVRNSY